MPRFLFGDIVVVEKTLIGVIVKTLRNEANETHYEVYIREFEEIKVYREDDVERYRVRHRFLNEEEYLFQNGIDCIDGRALPF
ncbi:MAG: hypothetical protein IKL88_03485 [Erysipelotrichales bacterium]|nr:hypothetical protein [Erysipelotrichales bacterium]